QWPVPWSLSLTPALVPSHACPLSLHDALPISGLGGMERQVSRYGARVLEGRRRPALGSRHAHRGLVRHVQPARPQALGERQLRQDRKSTRLNSSHQISSYAVFCLNKQNASIRI